MTSSAFDTPSEPTASDLVAMLRDARTRTLELVAGLEASQLLGPKLRIVNPLLWEIGHLAWFHEHFILRHLDGAAPLRTDADRLYDSSAVPHDTRWDLPLPSLEATLGYMAAVEDRLVQRLAGTPSSDELYLYRLTGFHEDMHGEAFTYSRQSLGWPTPAFAAARVDEAPAAGPLPGDVEVPGGRFQLGAEPGAGFAFDNEKWAHEVEVAPFRMARAPVTNEAYAAFVADGGYVRREWWSEAGWAWRGAAEASRPIYWLDEGGGGFTVKHFEAVRPLAPHQPVMNVNWHEASAWCRWAGRRLPSEAEWEFAAAATMDGGKRDLPWAGTSGIAERANLDGCRLGPVDVAAFCEGDSAFGCRQMIGNVWEWTSSDFLPYPGFSPDIYADYSVPAFGKAKVLRGGAWITRSRMINARYRNYFPAERRDIYAGFRTIAA